MPKRSVPISLIVTLGFLGAGCDSSREIEKAANETITQNYSISGTGETPLKTFIRSEIYKEENETSSVLSVACFDWPKSKSLFYGPLLTTVGKNAAGNWQTIVLPQLVAESLNPTPEVQRLGVQLAEDLPAWCKQAQVKSLEKREEMLRKNMTRQKLADKPREDRGVPTTAERSQKQQR